MITVILVVLDMTDMRHHIMEVSVEIGNVALKRRHFFVALTLETFELLCELLDVVVNVLQIGEYMLKVVYELSHYESFPLLGAPIIYKQHAMIGSL
jgi:hypothetical protein